MPVKLEKTEWEDYIPEALGNRARYLSGEDPEPIVVAIHSLSAREARGYQKKLIASAVTKGKSDLDFSKAIDLQREMFVGNVSNIRGLYLNGEPVTTADQLWDDAPLQLVEEIKSAIEDRSVLDQGRRDRLSSQSAGGPPATTA